VKLRSDLGSGMRK